MYRRRRSQREKIAFSFDSFLDVVANVNGIIIRLILVTWVGARSYTAMMNQTEEEAPPVTIARPNLPPLPAPRPEDDSLTPELAQTRKEIEQIRSRLMGQLHQLDLVQAKDARTRQDLNQVVSRSKNLEKDKEIIDNLLEKRGLQVQTASLSVEELKAKSKELQEEILAVEKLPTPTKVLRYHTPVSRPVRSDEVFFECKGGKVTFIDLPAFMHEIRDTFQDKSEQLRTQWEVTVTTAPVGAFRMQYVVERRRDFVDSLATDSPPPRNAHFNYGLSGWVLEPITENRGETMEKALAPGSYFHQIVDGLDAQQAVVTLWVYPDSFALFRQLRDFLSERDIEVAGRPLPLGNPIAASKHGTASRGQ